MFHSSLHLLGSRTVRGFTTLLLSLALGACVGMGSKTQSLAVGTAAAGVAATDAALASYNSVDPMLEQEWINAKTGDLLALPANAALEQRVLAGLASPSAAQEAQRARRKASLAARRKAARELQEAYRAFNRLGAGTFGSDTTAAFNEATEAVTSFADARGLPLGESQIPGIVGRALGEIISGLQARDIRRHNAVLAELSLQFQTLWNADLPALEAIVDGAYNMELAQSMAGLPNSAFDQAAVGKLVPEPVAGDLKLRLYRMRLLTAAAEQANAAKAPLRTTGKALGALQEAHVELAKERPSLADAIDAIDRVLELSKAAEEGTPE